MTAQITADLLPDISAQPLPGCNGCRSAQGAYVFAEENLIALDVTTLAAGKGPGTILAPQWLDATTLEPLTDTATIPPLQKSCGSEATQQTAVAQHILRNHVFSRYVVFNNLQQVDGFGAETRWRDGLRAQFVNPRTAQIYASNGLVLDAQTLSPVGQWPMLCLFTYDAERGLLFGRGTGKDAGTLFVMAERASTVTATGAQESKPLSLLTNAQPIQAVHVAPDFVQDQTVFVIANDGLLRSQDGGESWVRLRSIPINPTIGYRSLYLQLALSPNYAQDQTLFLAGHDEESLGLGVWRSQDGGAAWHPLWAGLAHLRVTDLQLSAAFAQDQTLLAHSDYTRVQPWETGYSIHQSVDGGLSWSLITTATNKGELPDAADLLPPAAQEDVHAVRFNAQDNQIEYTPDGGQTWSTVDGVFEDGCRVVDLLTTPAAATVYVLGQCNLWRTVDGGETWQRWDDVERAKRPFDTYLTAGTVAVNDTLASHQLMIGTAQGELWMRKAADLTWVAQPSSPETTTSSRG